MESEQTPKPVKSFRDYFTPRVIRIATWIVGVVLVLVVVRQNWEPVDTPILFLTIRMPRALFMLLLLAAGFVLGLVTPGLLRRKKDAK